MSFDQYDDSLDVDSLKLISYLNDEKFLRSVSKTVDMDNIDLNIIRKFSNLLIEKMRDPVKRGIGLSAVQVGKLVRIFVVDVIPEINGSSARNIGNIDSRFLYDRELYEQGYSNAIEKTTVFINPEITISGEEVPFVEGCLSLLHTSAVVKRPRFVHVKYFDVDGKQCEKKLYGLPSVCIQHENDHLNGILYIDHLSEKEREKVINALKMAKNSRV